MGHQGKFNEACISGNLTVIADLLNNHNIDVHACNECGFRLACSNGHLNVVQYLLENNFNINVHAGNKEGFRHACKNGHSLIVQYLLTKMKMTNKIIKTLCKNKCEYFDEIKRYIKNHKYVVKLFDNKLQSCKILFVLYKTMNIENTIYFGII